MNLNTFLSFDVTPFCFEFFLHFSPSLHCLFLKLSDSHTSRFLELIKSIFSLNNSRFFHEIFQLRIGRISFVSSITFLNVNCGKDWTIRSSEFLFWVHYWIPYLLFVYNAAE